MHKPVMDFRYVFLSSLFVGVVTAVLAMISGVSFGLAMARGFFTAVVILAILLWRLMK